MKKIFISFIVLLLLLGSAHNTVIAHQTTTKMTNTTDTNRYDNIGKLALLGFIGLLGFINIKRNNKTSNYLTSTTL